MPVIVSCTNCEHAFAIEEQRIPEGGLRIRCARCGEPLFVRRGDGAASQPVAPPAVSEEPFPYERTPIDWGESTGRRTSDPASGVTEVEISVGETLVDEALFAEPSAPEPSRSLGAPKETAARRGPRWRWGTRALPKAAAIAVALVSAGTVWLGWGAPGLLPDGTPRLAPSAKARLLERGDERIVRVSGDLRLPRKRPAGHELVVVAELVDAKGKVVEEGEARWSEAELAAASGGDRIPFLILLPVSEGLGPMRAELRALFDPPGTP